MEKPAAVTMCLHSIENHNVCSTIYVGDGNSFSLGEAINMAKIILWQKRLFGTYSKENYD